MNQTKPEPDAKKEPDAKPETGTSAPEPVSESITASIEHDLLEADATGTEPTPPVGSEETKDPETKEPDKKEEPDNQNVDILIGYGVFYDIEVNNKKASSWTDALKTKAKGLLGGMYSDLLSWKIRWRGSNLHVGKLLDPKFYKSNVLGIQEIDKAQVGNLVQDAFKGEFNTGVVAKGMSNEEVENILNKYGKLTNKIRNQMRHEGENCVVIELDRGDNAYKTDPK